jgi:chromosomal replication initiator protein
MLDVNKSFYQVTIEDICNNTCEFFHVSREEFLGGTRTHKNTEIRHIVMFLASELTDMKCTEIATFFKKRSHATVLHAIKTVKERLKTDHNLFATINAITSHIKDL